MSFFLNAAEEMEVVAEAADGQEAIELASRHQPDVVIMDYAMPGMNGAEATSQIAAVSPQSRVIGYSNNDSQSVAEAMIQAGAVYFLPKRSSLPELMEAIRQA